MRFDTPVYFQLTSHGEYDPQTGDYGPEQLTETKRWASVTNTGAQALTLVYGSLRQGSLTVRLQQHYDAPFDTIRIGEKRYRVDLTRPLRRLQTFVVSEVP